MQTQQQMGKEEDLTHISWLFLASEQGSETKQSNRKQECDKGCEEKGGREWDVGGERKRESKGYGKETSVEDTKKEKCE